MLHDYYIGPASRDDVVALPGIERAAAEVFSPVDLPPNLREETTSEDEFQYARHEGRLWVARSRDGTVVGFALATYMGKEAYLKEMDVLPQHAGRGIGRALVEMVCEWAHTSGFVAVSLTTFRHIPWNGPFYTKCGFVELGATELSSDLRDILSQERGRGFDAENRIAMRFDFSSSKGRVQKCCR